uniref:PfkB family carbohydrate kinase n=1 Tax=Falsiroseomonas oryzae TaxID=2766473 RepID=UPI0022EA3A3F
GAATVFAGCVGRDGFAEVATAALREAGVDLARLRVVEAPTGCAAICVDPRGRNQIAVAPGANLDARAAQVEDAALGPGVVLLLQMEVPPAEVASLIHRAKARGARVVLNLAPPGELPLGALRALDLLVVNEHEAAVLAARLGCAADAGGLRGALQVDVAVTLGEAGAEAAT